ncbi:MAG: universal stress protein [Halobacteriaceae archaeon]
MYDDVLVPTDGGDEMDEVLDHAITIAGDHDATVHGLYVVNKRLYLASEKERQDDVIEELRQEGERAVSRVADRAAEAGLDAVSEVRQGVPGREVLTYADEADIDLVVMGTHDPTDRDRPATLGSVADRVTNEASVPVLTVRLDGD